MKRDCPFTVQVLGIGLLLVGRLHVTAVSAQVVTPKDLEEQAKQFTRTSEMIPMRDGVRLHTAVYAPKDHKTPLSFVMIRTLYGIESRGPKAQIFSNPPRSGNTAGDFKHDRGFELHTCFPFKVVLEPSKFSYPLPGY